LAPNGIRVYLRSVIDLLSHVFFFAKATYWVMCIIYAHIYSSFVYSPYV
jgi:hypothetical protein